ncbi:hypothetical protein U1Q18_051675 [Sarracenia purpurea var. burkii]
METKHPTLGFGAHQDNKIETDSTRPPDGFDALEKWKKMKNEYPNTGFGAPPVKKLENISTRPTSGIDALEKSNKMKLSIRHLVSVLIRRKKIEN